jgi:hypothetical protein
MGKGLIPTPRPTPEKLVEEFAYHVQAQTEQLMGGDAKIGNKQRKEESSGR